MLGQRHAKRELQRCSAVSCVLLPLIPFRYLITVSGGLHVECVDRVDDMLS